MGSKIYVAIKAIRSLAKYSPIFTILGDILSLGLFFSPAPLFWRVYRRQYVGLYHIIPYIAEFFNCAMLIYNAILLPRFSIDMVIVNSIGCAIEAVYIFVHIRYYSQRNSRIRAILYMSVGTSIYVLLVPLTYLLLPEIKRDIFVNFICFCISLLVYGSPLQTVVHVIRTRDIDAMPIALSVLLLLNALLSFVNSFLENENDGLAVSAIFGVISCMVQIITYMVFKWRRPEYTFRKITYIMDKKRNEDGELSIELRYENRQTGEF